VSIDFSSVLNGLKSKLNELNSMSIYSNLSSSQCIHQHIVCIFIAIFVLGVSETFSHLNYMHFRLFPLFMLFLISLIGSFEMYQQIKRRDQWFQSNRCVCMSSIAFQSPKSGQTFVSSVNQTVIIDKTSPVIQSSD